MKAVNEPAGNYTESFTKTSKFWRHAHLHFRQNTLTFRARPYREANMPLIDGFGRSIDYLRVSVTDRCNFRCVYCMPHDGVQFMPREELLTYDELERIIGVFVNLGIEKIRINYKNSRHTITLNKEQQAQIKKAVQCVGEAMKLFPIKP